MGKIENIEPSVFLDIVMKAREELAAELKDNNPGNVDSAISVHSSAGGDIALIFSEPSDYVLIPSDKVVEFVQQLMHIIATKRPDLVRDHVKNITDRLRSKEK